ncbi:MAG: ThiF family adenylyltransferase, partial [Cetobacterium sp.]
MIFQRTELLIGTENLDKLNSSHVLVFGVGGVGGFVVEALVRAGVGELTVVDF